MSFAIKLFNDLGRLESNFQTLKENSTARTLENFIKIQDLWNRIAKGALKDFLASLDLQSRQICFDESFGFRDFFITFFKSESSDFDLMIERISALKTLFLSLEQKPKRALFLTQSICDCILDGVVETGTLASYKKQLAEADIQAGCLTNTIQANIQLILQKIETLEKELSSQTGDDAS